MQIPVKFGFNFLFGPCKKWFSLFWFMSVRPSFRGAIIWGGNGWLGCWVSDKLFPSIVSVSLLAVRVTAQLLPFRLLGFGFILLQLRWIWNLLCWNRGWMNKESKESSNSESQVFMSPIKALPNKIIIVPFYLYTQRGCLMQHLRQK